MAEFEAFVFPLSKRFKELSRQLLREGIAIGLVAGPIGECERSVIGGL